MARFGHDVRLAVRSLLGAKGPVAIAIVTLALGVGVTSAVFSILDALVLRPVPFANADRLCEILNYETKSQVSHPGFNRALLAEWRQQTDLFERIEGFDVTSFVYDATSGAEMLTGAVVSPGPPADAWRPAARGPAVCGGRGPRRRRSGDADQRDVLVSRARRDPAAIGRRLAERTQLQRRRRHAGELPISKRISVVLDSAGYRRAAGRVQGLPSRLEVLALRRDVPFDVVAGRVKERGAELNRRAGGPAGRTAMLLAPDSISIASSSSRSSCSAAPSRSCCSSCARTSPACRCPARSRARATTPFALPWARHAAISCARHWSSI